MFLLLTALLSGLAAFASWQAVPLVDRLPPSNYLILAAALLAVWAQNVISAYWSERGMRLSLAMQTDLTHCDLQGANLSDAYLRERRLDGAKLSNANLTHTDLVRATMVNARS